MTSVYKKDLGNGVVIYADDYVNTGRWVFDCEYRRLISREPLPAPLDELDAVGTLTIGNMYALNDADKDLAKGAIRAIAGVPDWYKGLRYLYSVLNDYSEVDSHVFYLLANHADRKWAIEVDQSVGHDGKSSFKVTAAPYDSATYVDYVKALQAAAKSCSEPQ